MQHRVRHEALEGGVGEVDHGDLGADGAVQGLVLLLFQILDWEKDSTILQSAKVRAGATSSAAVTYETKSYYNSSADEHHHQLQQQRNDNNNRFLRTTKSLSSSSISS